MERAGLLIGKLRIPTSAINPEELSCAAWPSAVGKKIAARTAAVSLVRGCLIVEVEDSLWQRQLTTLKPQIVKRLQQLVGESVVNEVAFRPMVPRRQPQRAGTSRPTFELAADEADRIADPILRRVYKASRRRATA